MKTIVRQIHSSKPTRRYPQEDKKSYAGVTVEELMALAKEAEGQAAEEERSQPASSNGSVHASPIDKTTPSKAVPTFEKQRKAQ